MFEVLLSALASTFMFVLTGEKGVGPPSIARQPGSPGLVWIQRPLVGDIK